MGSAIKYYKEYTSQDKRRNSIILPQDIKIEPKSFIQQNNSKSISKHYISLKKISENQYGFIRKVKHIQSQKDLQLKQIRIQSLNPQERKNLENEIKRLKQLDHQHIIHIWDQFCDQRYYYIITDLVEGGELFEKIQEVGEFDIEDAKIIIQQILQVLNYIHSSMNIMHRDIKPENILLKKNNLQDLENGHNYDIQVIEWGTAVEFKEKSYQTELLGSPYYMAPEFFQKPIKYNEKVDIWAAGVIFHILLLGEPPFDGNEDSEILEKIQKFQDNLDKKEHPINDKHKKFQNIKISEIDNNNNKQQKDSNQQKDEQDDKNQKSALELALSLLIQMLQRDPAKRISAQDALKHKFFQNQQEIVTQQSEFVEQMRIISKREVKTNIIDKFCEAILLYIAIKNDKDINQLKKFFNMVDQDSNGLISITELKEFLFYNFLQQNNIQNDKDDQLAQPKSQNQAESKVKVKTKAELEAIAKAEAEAQDIAQKFFDKNDLDKNQTLSYSEFLASMLNPVQSNNDIFEVYIKQAFNNFSTNQDEIDEKDFSKILQHANQNELWNQFMKEVNHQYNDNLTEQYNIKRIDYKLFEIMLKQYIERQQREDNKLKQNKFIDIQQ